MGKLLTIIGAVILTSFYLFPFDFIFLSGVNTKLIMAVVSIAIVITNLARSRKGIIDKDILLLCLFAFFVSFFTLFSVFYNNTRDYTYVTYIISMLVWTGGAYTLVTFIKWIHGKITVPILTYYLIAACTMQCLLALAINRFSAVEDFCSSFCLGLSDIKRYINDGRLYGVGCVFDPAGLRFAAVLVLMGYFFPRIVEKYNKRNVLIIMYAFAFILISVVGNIISRTTIVGMIIALAYIIIYSLRLHTLRIDIETNRLWKWMCFLLFVSIVLIIPLYHGDASFREEIRFGFEGFFSLFEKGKWEVHSNNQLLTMYRFPETFKTWIVGDGYFFNTNLDPYYTGVEYKEYYMAIDVGYLRFIYYSGIIGLGAFILFMCKVAVMCMFRHRECRMLFFLLLILQFVIWFKVASDIFCVFALFLVIEDVSVDENGLQKKSDIVD